MRGAQSDQADHRGAGPGAQLSHAPQQQPALGHAHSVITCPEPGICSDDVTAMMNLKSHDDMIMMVTVIIMIMNTHCCSIIMMIKKAIAIMMMC